VRAIVDENLSPALAKALNALFAGEHTVIHLRDKFGHGVADVDWIKSLSDEGSWVVISGDRRITKNRVEAEAFRRSNLVGFFLSKGLYKSRVTKQMERLLALWETIERQVLLVQGGAMFELPMKSTRLAQLKV
jgi:hypothetical protein